MQPPDALPATWQRLLALSGVAFAVLFVVGWFASGGDAPDYGAADQAWTDWADDNKWKSRIGAFAMLLAGFVFLHFAGTIRSVLGTAETTVRDSAQLARVAFAGALIGIAGMTTAIVMIAAASSEGADANPVVSRAVTTASAGPFLVAAMGFAALLTAAGLLTLRSGVFARWVGIVALLGAISFLITFLTLIAGTGEDSVFGFGFFPGVIALVIWSIPRALRDTARSRRATRSQTRPARFRAGLARTGDGILHLAWPAKNGTKEDIRHRTVPPSGTPVDAEEAIAPGWAGVQNPDLIVEKGGNLRIFFGGTRSTAPAETNRAALHTATAPPSGNGWTLQPGRVAQSTDAYAASVGAGLAGDGTPITAFATSGGLGLRFHFGLTAATPDHRLPAGCCQYDPDVAFDAGTGQAVLGWFSNEEGAPGLYAQAVSPSGAIGQRQRVPGSASADGKRALGPGQRTSISGRLGAPGVYLAYGAGYPTHGSVNLWRFGAAGPALALRRRGAENVGIAAAPSGRLWLMWEEGDAIYATRTNMAATRVGPLIRLALPARSSSVFSVQGEGSLGPLDLVVNAGRGNDLAFWHQHVLPRLTLAAKVSQDRGKTSSVRFTVLDAGDPVQGARIAVGSRVSRTDPAGHATMTFSGNPRPYRALATKTDYTAGKASFRT